MARPPSSGGPGPRPPLGGNGGGSGRAAPGNGTAGKKRSSPAGPGLGQRHGRCEPRGGSCRGRAPLSRAAGALCSLPSATEKVAAFFTSSQCETEVSYPRGEQHLSCERSCVAGSVLPGIAAHRSGVTGARRVSAARRAGCAICPLDA